MAERPCKASDTSSDDHPASILYPVRQPPPTGIRQHLCRLPSRTKKGAPHKKGNLRTQKKGASGLNPEAPLLFAAPGAEASAAWISS